MRVLEVLLRRTSIVGAVTRWPHALLCLLRAAGSGWVSSDGALLNLTFVRLLSIGDSAFPLQISSFHRSRELDATFQLGWFPQPLYWM